MCINKANLFYYFQEVDQIIGKLHKRLEKQWRDVGQTGTVLARMPEVIHSVNELSERIFALGELFDTVEKALMQLEDLVETRELQDRQLDHRFQLALYKEKKLSMLENVRGKIKFLKCNLISFSKPFFGFQ